MKFLVAALKIKQVPYKDKAGSALIANRDLENIMTFVFSGFSFILHLAHHLASLSKSLCKYSAAKSMFLLTAHWPASSGHIFESFCSEQSSLSRGRIEIAQLVADWLIRLPIRTCVKPPVTSDCSLAPKLLFVDWLKILANEKQAVQFRSPNVLVC